MFYDDASTSGRKLYRVRPLLSVGNASMILWHYQRNEVSDNRVTSQSLRQE